MNVHNAWNKVTVKSLKSVHNRGDIDFLNVSASVNVRKSASNLDTHSKVSKHSGSNKKVFLLSQHTDKGKRVGSWD